MIKVSPSQISTWDLCNRKWYFVYLSDEPKPEPTKSQAIGTATHAFLEDYLKTGRVPALTQTDPIEKIAAKIFTKNVDLFPLPGKAESEQEVLIPARASLSPLGLEAVSLRGYFDWYDPVTEIVGDLKTVGDLKWVKDPETLATDVQAAVYTAARNTLKGQWVYIQQPGGAFRVVDFLVDRGGLNVAKRKALVIAERRTASNQTQADFVPNTGACDAFGGCPYRSVCQVSAAERLGTMFRGLRMPPIKEVKDMGLLDDLQAAVNGTQIAPTDPEAPDPESSAAAIQAEVTTVNNVVVIQRANPEDAIGTFGAGYLPAPVTPETVKAKRGRRINPPAAPAPDVPEFAAPSADKVIGELFVDAIPLHEDYTDFSEIFTAAQKAIEAEQGAPDYRAIDFKGAGFLLIAVVTEVRRLQPAKLSVFLATPEAKVCISTLTAMAKRVIRGL